MPPNLHSLHLFLRILGQDLNVISLATFEWGWAPFPALSCSLGHWKRFVHVVSKPHSPPEGSMRCNSDRECVRPILMEASGKSPPLHPHSSCRNSFLFIPFSVAPRASVATHSACLRLLYQSSAVSTETQMCLSCHILLLAPDSQWPWTLWAPDRFIVMSKSLDGASGLGWRKNE